MIGSTKTLLLISTATLEEMLRKGNVWYIRYYETFFDEVYVAYIVGKPHRPVTRGNTTLISLGSGRSAKFDIALAPYRLYQLSGKLRPTAYLTGDLVYSWWTCALVRYLFGAKIYLIPVCIPEEIYMSSRKSLSGFLPIWIERLFVACSLSIADRVLTGRNLGNSMDWLVSRAKVRRKLIVLDTVVDALPSKGFFETLQDLRKDDSLRPREKNGFDAVYVGRLHREKMVDDLVRMVSLVTSLTDRRPCMTLTLIGDGPDRPRLERLANQLDVGAMVRFLGNVRNEELPKHLLEADVFVSPLTGTSLREAALCGLPILAYDMDWIHGLLKHEETALLVPPHDVREMAFQMIRLMDDQQLRARLSRNVKDLAWQIWSPETVRESLRRAFGDVK